MGVAERLEHFEWRPGFPEAVAGIEAVGRSGDFGGFHSSIVSSWLSLSTQQLEQSIFFSDLLSYSIDVLGIKHGRKDAFILTIQVSVRIQQLANLCLGFHSNSHTRC